MATTLYYITLNTTEEARSIGRCLLAERVALCVNWYPITCAYLWQGSITEESEVVLIVKTHVGYRAQIEAIVKRQITYTNFIGELPLAWVNTPFQNWLSAEVPEPPPC